MKPYLPILPFLAKYPFLKVAGKFLEYEYGSLDRILKSNDELISSAKELGIKIVESALKGERFSELKVLKGITKTFLCAECEVKDCRSKAKDLFEMFRFCNYPVRSDEYYRYLKLAKKFTIAYIFSKIAVSNLSDALRHKFAVREARRYREMLESESVEFLKIVALDFGIRVKVMGNPNAYVFKVDVVDYLRGAVKIRDDEWKLVNRRLEDGFVHLTKVEFVRILEEYLRERLSEKIGIKINLGLKLETKVEDFDFKGLGIKAECYPPCMKKILSDLRNGLNVPHSARFAIAAFLLNIGVSIEDVVDIFRTAPDFDEDKTRYQVEHIAGQRGKSEEYVCPSCETMRSYGNCYPDENCSNVNHPIRYYINCLRRRK